jgi:hypothetical protein
MLIQLKGRGPQVVVDTVVVGAVVVVVVGIVEPVGKKDVTV